MLKTISTDDKERRLFSNSKFLLTNMIGGPGSNKYQILNVIETRGRLGFVFKCYFCWAYVVLCMLYTFGAVRF